MRYITGIFALNIRTMPDVCGDWHRLALDWSKACTAAYTAESEGSVWGDYGIVQNFFVHELGRKCNVANTIRALLDNIANKKFYYAEGMKDDYICNDNYTQEVFSKVIMLRDRPDWDEIDAFMKKEYMMEWVNYVKSCK